MKISNIEIKYMFGLKEFKTSGKSLELVGANKLGKTSIIDSIVYAWKNKSLRDVIVQRGEAEGSVIIETDTGLYARGKIGGEIRIFDYILTQDEVDYLYAYIFDEKTIDYEYLLTTTQRAVGAGITLIMNNTPTNNPLTFSEYDAAGNIPDPEGEGFAELGYDDYGGNITELYIGD